MADSSRHELFVDKADDSRTGGEDDFLAVVAALVPMKKAELPCARSHL